MINLQRIKKLTWLMFLLVSALVSSCDLFSAGSYPFGEGVYSACRRDTIISRLTRLKASSAFDHAYSFADIPNPPESPYASFYFYSQENNGVLHLVVGPGFDKEDAVVLVGLKEPRPGSQWQDFNHGLDKQRQQKVMAWFEEKIKPAIACK